MAFKRPVQCNGHYTKEDKKKKINVLLQKHSLIQKHRKPSDELRRQQFWASHAHSNRLQRETPNCWSLAIDKQSDNNNRQTKPKNAVLIMNMTSKIKSLSELCIICGQ